MATRSAPATGDAAKGVRGTDAARPTDVDRGLAKKPRTKTQQPAAAAPEAGVAPPPSAAAEPQPAIRGVGLYTYTVAKPGVRESITFCEKPENPLWQKAVRVGSIDDIVAAAKPMGRLTRLGILAHEGDWSAGSVGIGADQVNPLTVEKLRRLEEVLEPDATVYFFGCLAGKGKDGTVFLKTVSSLLKGRRVIGFTTRTQLNTQPNVGKTRREGGVIFGHTCADPDLWTTKTLEGETGLPASPATESAPEAKHARDGKIIRWPRDEAHNIPLNDATLEERRKFYQPRGSTQPVPVAPPR